MAEDPRKDFPGALGDPAMPTSGQKPSSEHEDKFIDEDRLKAMSPRAAKTKVRLPLIPWMLRIIYDIANGDENGNAARRAQAMLELYERNPRRADMLLIADDEYEIELIERIKQE